MKVDAVSRSKLKKVIFSSTEPSSTNVLWAKSTGDKCDMFIFKNGSWVNIKDNEIDPLVKDYIDAYYTELNGKIEENSKQISLQSNDIKSKLESVEKSSKEIVSTETNRAKQAEGELKDSIITETNRVTGVETKLDTKISSEISRATNAEKSLDTKITAINNTKQDKLISGTNIKTVNDESILGEGNIKAVPDIWANILSIEDTAILVDGKKVELPANKNVIIKDFRSVEVCKDANGKIFHTLCITLFDIHYNAKLVPIDKFDLSDSRGYSKLHTLDVSCFDTTNMTSLSYAFKCMSLEYYDISGWNTSNVTSLCGLFKCNNKVKHLYLGGWDTSKVTDMDNAFDDCDSLITLEQNFDTSKVTYMSRMFCNDGNLTTVDVSNWDVSNCRSCSAIFYNCHSITNLDTSKWNTKNAIYMSGLFFACYNLETLDISNFDTTNSVFSSNMFTGDRLLSDIKFGVNIGKSTVGNSIIDLSTVASSVGYKFTDNTYESMLTMYDRIANNLTNTFTIKFSSKHNIPDGWIDKMTARGYTISIV